MARQVASRTTIRDAILNVRGRLNDFPLPDEPEDLFDRDTIAIHDPVDDFLLCVSKEFGYLKYSWWSQGSITALTAASLAADALALKEEANQRFGTLPAKGVFSSTCPVLVEHGRGTTDANITLFNAAWVLTGFDPMTVLRTPGPRSFPIFDARRNQIGENFFSLVFSHSPGITFTERSQPPVIG